MVKMISYFGRFDIRDFPLVFGGDKIAYTPYEGIVRYNYRPFKMPDEISKEYIIPILYEKNYDEKLCQELKEYLEQGTVNKNSKLLPKGFTELFKFDLYNKKILFECIPFTNYDENKIFDSYEKNSHGKISIIILSKTPRSEYESIYYKVKSKFLSHGIPTQIVTQETIGNKNTLFWSVFPIMLQLFTKMGGIPYALKRKISFLERGEIERPEAVIIAGLAISIHPLRKGSKIGSVLVFDSHGIWYYMKSKELSCMYDKQTLTSESIESLLKESIEDILNINKNYIDSERNGKISIIMHYQGKDLKRDEEIELLKVIKEVSNEYNVAINIFPVKIKNSNIIFVEENNGIIKYASTGNIFKISDFYLLNLVGSFPELGIRNNKEFANIRGGSPHSLIISIKKFYNESINENQKIDLSLIRSVYATARLNYRAPNNPLTKQPVTTLYSQEIAWILSRVDITKLPEKIHKVMWFL